MNFSLSMELQRAWRRLLRAPGFSLSVILLIAFSIGGVAAVATAGWSLFARPLPYQEADQLVTISGWYKRGDSHAGLSAALVDALNREQGFGTIGIVERPFALRLADGSAVRAGRIDHRLLDVLRVSPLAGRVLTEHDTAPGAAPVALISERLWRARFGADSEIIDWVVDLKDGRVRVVGVLPNTLALPASDTDIWLPMELGPEKLSPGMYSTLQSHTVIARADQDVGMESYHERLLARLANDERLNSRERPMDIEYRVRPLRELWSAGQGDGLLILAVATGVVLLAAWLNLAGLWLARWTGRTHELAIQFALGARSGLATVGVVLEYALLGIPGLVLAIGIASLGVEVLYALEVLDENGPLRAGLAFPTIMSGVVLLAFGLLPVLIAIRWNMRRLAHRAAGNLGGKGTGMRGGGAGMRKLLMIGQIGIAFSLLLALGLLLTSWLKLLNEDLGFDSRRLVTAMVASPQQFQLYPDVNVAAAADRLRNLPGVDSVSWSNVVPFGGMEFISGFIVDGRPGASVAARPRSVGPGFFGVAGIDSLSGRTFGFEDAGDGIKNVIVDEVFERMYLDGSGVGRRVSSSGVEHMVVGVVESVPHRSPDQERDNPTIYTYSDTPESQTQLLVRTSMDPASIVAVVRDTLERELGEERLYFVESVESRVRNSVSDREPQLILLGTFAGLALLLVFYGLYALQSYQVASGTAEIGLRRAMGASRPRIIGAELARAAGLLPPGLLLGMLGGWLGMRLIDERLYKVGLADPELLLATGAAIALTIMLAGLVPALRASRVEPLEALRYE
ncbi:MAG: ABC transporter permease [Wenzhouxiangellaceae bacterium]